MPLSQTGLKARCYILAVGPPFVPHGKILDEGGGADVEKAVAQGNLFFGRYRNPHVPVSHKRVLTARPEPERSTVVDR